MHGFKQCRQYEFGTEPASTREIGPNDVIDTVHLQILTGFGHGAYGNDAKEFRRHPRCEDMVSEPIHQSVGLHIGMSITPGEYYYFLVE